jgi:dTDP-4-dehydrorhamnose 3,5-epimerase
MEKNMNWKNGKLDGVKLITPDVFEDYRGKYIETYDSIKYKEILGDIEFVQDDISISRKNVLRGLHGNNVTAKLISIPHGAIYALIADNRPESPTYKQWESHVLTAENRMQLFVPAGIGNSMIALEDMTVYHYKQNTHFEPDTQFTIQWNDPEWNFWWPISNPILSQRDFYGKYIK